MSVSTRRPGPARELPTSPPASLRRLEWEADRIRARAQGSSRGGVGYAEWAG